MKDLLLQIPLISINMKSESFGMKGKVFKKIGYIFFETSLRDFNKIYSFEALIINIIVKMENLLNSRLSRDASPSKLENLSPQKFGKAAFASLTYTPSKLVDNVLFKEVTTLKKIEEESSKVRESDAFNSILKDRLSQIIEERDGIEETLTKQILMYKKMLNENEAKHQQRIKDIQKSFNQEMQRLIASKEEEAKYSQSQKQLLEGRIEDLEAEILQLKDRLDHGGNTFDDLSREHEKLKIHFKNTCEKLEQAEEQLKQEREKAKNSIEELSRKLYNTEVDFKGKIDKLSLDQEKEKETLDRLHRNQLEKVQNKRAQQAVLKNQELKDLSATFEAEANRLRDIINSKANNIENLTSSLNEEKEKVLNLTKNYTTQITNLVHEKNRYKEEVDSLNLELTMTKEDSKKAEASAVRTINTLESTIAKLKEELQLSQINLIREKDRNAFVVDDLHREIVALQTENERVGVVGAENAMLCKEIRNLKELLLESSLEMEKCKEEFLRIGREKDHLAVKVRELGYENQTLHRIKYEKEEEAKGWRDSYYMSRR